MPELPEVECLSRAIRPILTGAKIQSANFFRTDLRGPIPVEQFNQLVVGETLLDVHRRSKYMLWETEKGWGIIHLGMTGNIIFRWTAEPEVAHTHAVFALSRDGHTAGYLHFIDPRRFGWITCCQYHELSEHPFFIKLGPEPLATPELGSYLWQKARKRQVAIKSFLMNANIVVGVGNIYANEALFLAGVRPTRPAYRVNRKEMNNLAEAIQSTLKKAISAGGTSFRDFRNASGEPGYFKLSLKVYGRQGENCTNCGQKILQIRQNNRSSFYCANCQK